MRTFNKVVAIILILLALPVGTLFLVLPDFSAGVASNLFAAIRDVSSGLDQPVRIGMTALAFVLDIVLLGLLYLEVRRKPTLGARVTAVRGIEGQVTLDAVRQRILHHVSQVGDVVDVEPEISARGGRIVVALEVVTSPHVNVPKKIDEILHVVREVVSGGMGLKLRGKPSVSIRHVDYAEVVSRTAVSSTTPPEGVSIGSSGIG